MLTSISEGVATVPVKGNRVSTMPRASYCDCSATEIPRWTGIVAVVVVVVVSVANDCVGGKGIPPEDVEDLG